MLPKISLHLLKSSKIDTQALNLVFTNSKKPVVLRGLSDKTLKLLKTKLKELAKTDLITQKSHHFSEGGLLAVFSLAKEFDRYVLEENLRNVFDLTLKSPNISQINIYIEGPVPNEVEIFESTLIALPVSHWKYPKKTKKPSKEKIVNYKVQVKSGLSKNILNNSFNEAKQIAEAILNVKTLSHMPPNYLTPTHYISEIKKFAVSHKLQFKFYDEKTLSKMNAGAFLAVSQGSSVRDSGIAYLHYKPKTKPLKVLSFVGKGICFDTGGYNIKPGAYMFGMHQDMTGSAVALAIIGLIAKLELPYEAHAYLALAENHVSPNSFKMNEVVFASNDMSIEVIHTDAEGRMVLADALAIASKDKPDYLFDYTTLTGSCIRALGTKRAGVFSNNSKLMNTIIEAGDKSGERVWPFPINLEYSKTLESKVADIKQCDSGGNADHIYAATFLNNFVDKNINWLHMDLSPVDNKGSVGLLTNDGSGFGIRWTMEMLKTLSFN